MHMDCRRSKVRNIIWGNGKDKWQMMPQKLFGFWVNLIDFFMVEDPVTLTLGLMSLANLKSRTIA